MVTIDESDRRSTAATVTLVTPSDTPMELTPDVPFSETDPDAGDVLARLGYPAARDLADDLVSTSYLSLYYDVDAALVTLFRTEERFGEDVAFACPGGRTALGDVNRPFVFDFVLDACKIDGYVLTGRLARETGFIVNGGGSFQSATVTNAPWIIRSWRPQCTRRVARDELAQAVAKYDTDRRRGYREACG